jgi:prophage regulatory protein
MDIRNKLFRIADVSELTTLAKSTIWLKVAKGSFPKPIKLSPAISVWREADINSWIESHANPSAGAENA